MGYGGRQSIRSGDIRRFNFTGNGSNTAFDLGFTPATQNQLIVTVNGLVQHYDAFSISGSTITFDGIPASGDTIQITAVVDAVGVAAIPDGAIANVSSLAVSGAATLSNTFAVTGNATFSNTVAITGSLTTTSNTATIGATLYSVANGNVGIGRGSPSVKLDIATAALGTALQLSDDTNYGASFIGISGGMKLQMNGTQVFTINQAGVGERMRIDSSGRVTIPYQPAFQAYRDAGHVTNNNVIVFNGVRFNIGSHYSNSTGRFTAPVAGVYQFNTHTMLVNGISGDHQISFRVNGGNYSTQNPGNGTFNVAFGLSEVIQLAVGDYVDVYYYDSASNSIYGSGGANWTGFSGHLIG